MGFKGKKQAHVHPQDVILFINEKRQLLYFSFSFLNAVFAGMFSAESHCLLIQSIVNIVPKKIKYY